jgi:hypothetical protein
VSFVGPNVVDITGKLESSFNSDSWANTDWCISQLDGNTFIDIVDLLRGFEGKTVRLIIEEV